MLKIKKAQNNITKNDINEVLFDGLNDCATQLEIFCTKAISAVSEREGVEALRNAYMKVASTRYYLEMLYLTGYIPNDAAEDMLRDCDHIESRLRNGGPRRAPRGGERTNGEARSKRTNWMRLPSTADEDEVELNDGKYDDMSDEEFYDALKEIFDQYLNDEDDYL